jgi:hypothetical protein
VDLLITKYWECVHWIYLAQDRDRERALVSKMRGIS